MATPSFWPFGKETNDQKATFIDKSRMVNLSDIMFRSWMRDYISKNYREASLIYDQKSTMFQLNHHLGQGVDYISKQTDIYLLMAIFSNTCSNLCEYDKLLVRRLRI